MSFSARFCGLTAALLLLAYTVCCHQHPQPHQHNVIPCTISEQSYLLNKCLMAFSSAHWNVHTAMRKATSCAKNLLKCPAAGRVVTCLNGISTPTLSKRCWNGLKETLSYLLQRFQFKCTYQDVENLCKDQTGRLTTRQFAGTG